MPVNVKRLAFKALYLVARRRLDYAHYEYAGVSTEELPKLAVVNDGAAGPDARQQLWYAHYVARAQLLAKCAHRVEELSRTTERCRMLWSVLLLRQNDEDQSSNRKL
jgi:hypothetical protein